MIEIGRQLYEYVYDGTDIVEHDCHVAGRKPSKSIRNGKWVYDEDDCVLTVFRNSNPNYPFYVHENQVDKGLVWSAQVYIVVLSSYDYKTAKRIFSDYFIERQAKLLAEMRKIDTLARNLQC